MLLLLLSFVVVVVKVVEVVVVVPFSYWGTERDESRPDGRPESRYTSRAGIERALREVLGTEPATLKHVLTHSIPKRAQVQTK